MAVIGTDGRGDIAAFLVSGRIDDNAIVVDLPSGHPLTDQNKLELLQVWCDMRDKMLAAIDPVRYPKYTGIF